MTGHRLQTGKLSTNAGINVVSWCSCIGSTRKDLGLFFSMVWTHAIDRQHPLMPDEAQCRRCRLAFIPFGPRRTYCSPACSAQPAMSPETQARRREAARLSGRPNATDRGYGHDHRKRRAEGLAAAYGTACGWCGSVMLA